MSETHRCGTCRRRLDDPADPVGSVDCGGDCRRCLADAGDGDEEHTLRAAGLRPAPNGWWSNP